MYPIILPNGTVENFTLAHDEDSAALWDVMAVLLEAQARRERDPRIQDDIFDLVHVACHHAEQCAPAALCPLTFNLNLEAAA